WAVEPSSQCAQQHVCMHACMLGYVHACWAVAPPAACMLGGSTTQQNQQLLAGAVAPPS
ncbi:unnamed protein product, partial [Musa textilis]